MALSAQPPPPPPPPPETEIPPKAIEKQKLNFSRRALFHMKIRISLKI